MILDTHAREYYTVTAAVDGAPVTALEVSLDGGQTWVPGEAEGTHVRWLIRGPSAPDDPATPSTVVSRNVTPKIRFTDSPEIVVRDSPPVTLRP